MKKWILLLFVLIFLTVLAIYVIIPSTIQVAVAIKLSCSPASAARGLLQEENWSKWLLPESERVIINGKQPEGFSYSVNSRLNRELMIDIKNGRRVWPSRLYIIPELEDSVSLKWQCGIESGINPLARWKDYRKAAALQQDMRRVLVRLKALLENGENIYDFRIVRTRVTDTVLISIRARYKNFPSTEEIYKLIEELRHYIKSQGAVETGYPMVHHDRIDHSGTETMVAIPVNRQLPQNGKFVYKRMVPGYILVAEVKGGPATVGRAFNEMENYILDNQKQKIAIPFESQVTNRMTNKDTSSWVTKVYFPIVK